MDRRFPLNYQQMADMLMMAGGPRWQFPSPPYKEILPGTAKRFQRRLDNSGSDEELTRIVRDAAKYGIDWTHMLAK